MRKTAAQLDAEIAAAVDPRANALRDALRDLDTNRRSVISAAQSLARTHERIKGILERKREELEARIENLGDTNPTARALLERELEKIDNASVPDGADVTQGIRDVLDDAKVKI